MAKVTIKIPHIVWRDGRPRFVPGPALRKLGYQGKDLKHPDNTWLDLNETIAWSEELVSEVETRRLQTGIKSKPGRKPKNHSVKGYVTVGELLEKWVRERAKDHKETGKPTKKTLEQYGYNVRALQKYDEELWTMPAVSVSDVLANGIYKKLREDKGIAMSKSLISTIRPAWHWAHKEMGLVKNNPWTNLRITNPPPRLRVGSIDEMKHLVATADRLGRPDIGDAIMLGLCSGQRQNDRLSFTLLAKDEGTLIFKQSKTGVIVEIPAIKPLTARLEAAKDRRNSKTKAIKNVLIDEKRGKNWIVNDGDSYRRDFREICNAAAVSMPSLKGFRDQDLRDTTVTWLADAGCTLPQIASITGHTVENIHKILKHYMAQTPVQANAAMKKLVKYIGANGGI